MAADGRGSEFPGVQLIAPRKHMGAGDRAEGLWGSDAVKLHEVPDDRFIDAPGSFVAQIGEPFMLRRHLRQCRKPRGGKRRR